MIPEQSGYNKRLRAAGGLIAKVIRELAEVTPTAVAALRLIDSTAVPCGMSRETAKRSDLAGEAGYGYCASHSRYFWGMRLYRVATAEGMPVMWCLANPKLDERGYFAYRLSTVDWNELAGAGLATAMASGDPLALAASHLSLAMLALLRGGIQDVIHHSRQALDHARRAGWTQGEGAALGTMGAAHRRIGQLEAAADFYLQALAIHRRIGWDAGEAGALHNLGTIDWGLGRLTQAADHLSRAAELHRRLGNTVPEAETLAVLGATYRALGRFDDALDVLTRAMAVHRQSRDRRYEGYTLMLTAEVHRDAGRYPMALDLAGTAAAIGHDLDERELASSGLAVLASIHNHLGAHRQAIDEYRRSAALARDVGDRYTTVDALIGLATAYRCSGRLPRAIYHARRAHRIAHRARYRLLEGQALTVFAAIHLDRGDRREMVRRCQQALAIHRRTGHRLHLAHTHLVAGRALGRRHLHAARALLTELGLTGQAGRRWLAVEPRMAHTDPIRRVYRRSNE